MTSDSAESCGVSIGGNGCCEELPDVADAEGRCILHSRNAGKDRHQLTKTISRLRSESTGGQVNLSGLCVFGDPFAIDLSGAGNVALTDAEFYCDVLLRAKDRLNNLNVARARFHGPCNLSELWVGSLSFEDAIWQKEMAAEFGRWESANLTNAEFRAKATFTKVSLRSINVTKASFAEGLRLEQCDLGSACLSAIRCDGAVVVAKSQFDKMADFSFASFNASVSIDAKLLGGTNFLKARFKEDVSFAGSEFRKVVTFSDASFGVGASTRIADFSGCQFLEVKVDFSGVNTSSPSGLRLRVRRSNLADQPMLDVHWHRSKGRRLLQDELDVYEDKEGLVAPEVVADAYSGFVRNFEQLRMYDHAEDFRCGEMEMRRRVRHSSWFHRSSTGLYGALSRYGSSYGRALIVFILLLVGFGGLFALPCAGLRLVPERHVSASTAVELLPEPMVQILSGIGHSIEVASFNRYRRYEVTTYFGNILEAVEIPVVAGQAALFLFALRRRFKH